MTVFTKSHRNPSRTEQAATEEKRVLLHEPREIRTVELKRANEEYVFRRNPTSVSVRGVSIRGAKEVYAKKDLWKHELNKFTSVNILAKLQPRT